MSRRVFFIVMLLGLAAPAMMFAAPKKKGKGGPPAGGPIMNQDMKVLALEHIWDFKLTGEQLRAMKAVVKTTMETPRQREEVAVDDKYRKTLVDLDVALVVGTDRDKIEQLQDALGDLVEAGKLELDEDIAVTAAALAEARKLVPNLTAKQMTSFITANDEEIRDPADLVLDTLSTADAAKWPTARDEAAEDAADLVTAGDEEKAKEIIAKLTPWMNEKHKLTAGEIGKARKALRADLKKTLGDRDWVSVLSRYAERDIALLLSNPQAAAAIDARLAAMKE